MYVGLRLSLKFEVGSFMHIAAVNSHDITEYQPRSEMFIFFVVMLQRMTWEVDPEIAPPPDAENVTMRVTTIPMPFHVKVRARS